MNAHVPNGKTCVIEIELSEDVVGRAHNWSYSAGISLDEYIARALAAFDESLSELKSPPNWVSEMATADASAFLESCHALAHDLLLESYSIQSVAEMLQQHRKHIQTLLLRSAAPWRPNDDQTLPAASKMSKALHERFAEKRVRGEWFALTTSDVCEVAEQAKKMGLVL